VDATIINPFLKAAVEVLGHELGHTPEKETLQLQDTYYTTEDVTVIVGVTGSVEGTVLLGMRESTARNMAARMLGAKLLLFDQMAESALSELGNVIAGSASIELEKAGYQCRVSPPSLIVGRGSVISTSRIRWLVIPFRLPEGRIRISVALRRTTEADREGTQCSGTP